MFTTNPLFFFLCLHVVTNATVILASDQTSTKHSVWMSMNVLRKMEVAGNTNASILMEAIVVNVILVISLIQSKHMAVFNKGGPTKT